MKKNLVNLTGLEVMRVEILWNVVLDKEVDNGLLSCKELREITGKLLLTGGILAILGEEMIEIESDLATVSSDFLNFAIFPGANCTADKEINLDGLQDCEMSSLEFLGYL